MGNDLNFSVVFYGICKLDRRKKEKRVKKKTRNKSKGSSLMSFHMRDLLSMNFKSIMGWWGINTQTIAGNNLVCNTIYLSSLFVSLISFSLAGRSATRMSCSLLAHVLNLQAYVLSQVQAMIEETWPCSLVFSILVYHSCKAILIVWNVSYFDWCPQSLCQGEVYTTISINIKVFSNFQLYSELQLMCQREWTTCTRIILSTETWRLPIFLWMKMRQVIRYDVITRQL